MEYQSIYTPDVIARLELGWGQGWLSPGGPREVSELVVGIDLADKSVLDIGVGTGGPAQHLIRVRCSARHGHRYRATRA